MLQLLFKSLLIFSVLASKVARATTLDELIIKSNLPIEYQDKLAKDFDALRSINGQHASLMNRYIYFTKFQLDGEDYVRFLERSIQYLLFTADPKRCGEGAQACAIYGHLILTPNYFNSSKIKRLGIILHEAQHLNSVPRHIVCPTPFQDANGNDIKSGEKPLQGIQACDNDEKGAYVAEVIFYRNVAENCTSCTPDERKEAASLANEFIYRILNDDLKTKIINDN